MTCQLHKCFQRIFSCRRVIYIMVVSGFVLNAALKIIFNITIVAMVKPSNETNTTQTFQWTESQKQDILGIFFWGFAFTKIPSGRLAEMIGSRKVTGYSMLVASLLTLVTPVFCYWNYYLLLASRVLLGIAIGASWPAIMPLAAKWIPPKEHSVFITCVASTGVGAAISFHLCGLLIDAYGWKSVFYVFGGVGLFWCIAWFYLIYDSPEQHPRISFEERYSLEKKIDKADKPKQMRFKEVPWVKLATSGPVWAIVAGQVATFFGYATICNELPSYLDQVLHLDIKQNGVFSGLPHWGGYIAALISGYVADVLRKTEKLSTTAIRKIFETIALAIPCCSMLVLALWGDRSTVALTAFTVSLTTNAISTSGHCANILDISRNFAGTICGLVNTVSAFSVYFSTKLVANLLQDGQSFNEWKYLFWTLMTVYAVATVVYLIFCSAKMQSWDTLKDNDDKNKEMLPLDNPLSS